MNEDEKRYCLIIIDGNAILDDSSFHDVFAEELGFPDFYGRNLDAWIDCLTYCDDPGSEMTSVVMEQGQVLVLQIDDAGKLKSRCPDVFEGLIDCIAFVNHRRMEIGEPPVLALSYSA